MVLSYLKPAVRGIFCTLRAACTTSWRVFIQCSGKQFAKSFGVSQRGKTSRPCYCSPVCPRREVETRTIYFKRVKSHVLLLSAHSQVAPRHLSDMASSGHLMLLALALLATTGAQARKAASRSLKRESYNIKLMCSSSIAQCQRKQCRHYTLGDWHQVMSR